MAVENTAGTIRPVALNRSSFGLAVSTLVVAGLAMFTLVTGYVDAASLDATGHFAVSFGVGLLGGSLLWFL